MGASDLRRLTRSQYVESIRALFGDAITQEMDAALAAIPRDNGGTFSSLSRGVTSVHVEAYYAVSEQIAQRIAHDPDQRAALLPCLRAPTNAETCATEFIRTFGRRAFRQEVTTEQAADLMAVLQLGLAASLEEGVLLVLMGVLNSPAFLYLPEVNGQANQLDQYELATRLAYALWGGPPDSNLLDAAATAQLSTPEQLTTHITRMLLDGRARTHLGLFYNELLGLDAVAMPDPTLVSQVGGTPAALRAAAVDELRQFLDLVTFDQLGSYQDLMSSSDAVVSNDALGAVYGVSAGDMITALPASQRGGLLTRAAVLMGQGLSSSPIQRGVFVLRRLLCADLRPPDPSAFPAGLFMHPPFDPQRTGRARWEHTTSPQACAGCHTRINPLGFALENYDPIGRHRLVETIYDPATGGALNTLPVDPTVDLFLDRRAHAVANAVELSSVLGASEEANRCFARQWFRFATGRREAAEDQCVIEDMTHQLMSGGGIVDMVASLVAAPEFQIVSLLP